MLCNEGRRRVLQAREERDQTRRRLLNIQSLLRFQSNTYIYAQTIHR